MALVGLNCIRAVACNESRRQPRPGAKRFGVAKRARVCMAMGAWSQVTCLCPCRTGVHSLFRGIFGGDAGTGSGGILTPADDGGIRGGTPGGNAGLGWCMYCLRIAQRVLMACY